MASPRKTIGVINYIDRSVAIDVAQRQFTTSSRRENLQPRVLLLLIACCLISAFVITVSHHGIERLATSPFNSEQGEVALLLPTQRHENKQQDLTALSQHTDTEINNGAGNSNNKLSSSSSSDNSSRSFTVDILSVGSIQQLDLLHAQRTTFASHISIRNFFNVTENDDADPDCHKYLTWDDVQKVSSFCRNRPPSGMSHVSRHMRGKYARAQWLQKKKNPVGWMCAQVRPTSGLMKAYQHYRDNIMEGLPDYFIIMDDDTYYDMEEFERNFGGMNSSEALYYAGCLVRDPVHQINFTFPFGGFGSILSKGALRNLFEPIHCPTPPLPSSSSSVLVNDQHQPLCDRIAENNVDERPSFQTGMNLAQLMYQYVNAHKYRDVNEWEQNDNGGGGFCMHSDWVIGYFANYYNVSRHVVEPFYADVPHARIEPYKNSEIYKKGTGFCVNEGNNCKEGSELCHRATPQWMKDETDRLRLKVPTKYVTG